MKHLFFSKLQNAHERGQFAQFIKESANTGELFEQMPALKDLNKVPQDPRWHPEGDAWTHTLLVVSNLPSDAPFTLCLAALLHDTGKATTTVVHDTGRITSHGHENESKRIANDILNEFGAEPKLKDAVLFLVYRHMLAHSKDTTLKTMQKLIREGGSDLVEQLLLHGEADVKGGCGDLTECIRLRQILNDIYTESELSSCPK